MSGPNGPPRGPIGPPECAKEVPRGTHPRSRRRAKAGPAAGGGARARGSLGGSRGRRTAGDRGTVGRLLRSGGHRSAHARGRRPRGVARRPRPRAARRRGDDDRFRHRLRCSRGDEGRRRRLSRQALRHGRTVPAGAAAPGKKIGGGEEPPFSRISQAAPGGAEPAHGPGAAGRDARGCLRHHRAPLGRERHRKKPGGALHPFQQRPCLGAFRRGALRRTAGKSARGGAVRARERSVHRRGRTQGGPPCRCRRRHALPRRDRRDHPCNAGQALALLAVA